MEVLPFFLPSCYHLFSLSPPSPSSTSPVPVAAMYLRPTTHEISLTQPIPEELVQQSPARVRLQLPGSPDLE